MSAFTKGPWFDDGYRIYAPTPDADKCNGRVIVEYKHVDDFNRADAPLLTAAPELYDALHGVLTAYRLPDECVHASEPEICDGCRYATEKAMIAALNVAAAAIAKADGHLDTHPSSQQQRAR